MDIRVRFAPSPTGHVHIGNIRAAIFNWLYARHNGGKFLLRVEDTDLERSTDEAKKTLVDVMKWLNLDWDEEPLFQSTRVEAHRLAANELVAAGKAYRLARKGDAKAAVFFRIPCDIDDPKLIRFAGPVSLDIHPEVPVKIDLSGITYAGVSKKGKPVESASCLAACSDLRLSDASGSCVFDMGDQLKDVLSGEKAFNIENAVKMEFTRKEVLFTDLVKGEMSKPMDGMKDLVIVRSDDSPVFHLANVCDDIHQGVTHIIRGDDHVENTFRHILLYHALGCASPEYAHLPMIVNASGKPYSKRDGDAYVGDFRAKGIESDALFNYLTLLGWSPGDDREMMERDEIIELFTLDRVRSAPSQMDLKKLTHLNGLYIAEMPKDVFCERAFAAVKKSACCETEDDAYFRSVCALLQSRTTAFSDVANWKHFFTEEFEYDEKSFRKFLEKDGVKDTLTKLCAALRELDFSEENIENAIREVEKSCEINEGKLNQPLRIALTGTPIGAGIYETMMVLGKERSISRLEKVVNKL